MTEHPTVLITGATKVIGRALVERFAPAAGEMHLVARNARDLEALKQDLASEACRVYIYPADLSDPVSVMSLAESLLDDID